jgi:GntR family transcriptional regulator, rspAB operon transcriptional repressor
VCTQYMVYHIPQMSLQPIRSSSISEIAYKSIEEAIISGELGPGMILSDRKLSTTLGISRTPVREALQSLERSGLVVRRGRIGWRVAGFDQEDASELFELRRIMELPGLQRLAESWDADTVRELSTFFEGFSEPLASEGYEEYLARDHDFHKRIVALTGNERLIRFYGIVEKQINRIRHYLAPGYEGRMGKVVAEHRRICAAIANHDLEEASRALMDHLWAGNQAMSSFLRAEQASENHEREPTEGGRAQHHRRS